MVQSPSWEANWFVASQEIPRISRNPKVHYRTRKRPPPVSILGQPNPVHISTSHLLEIHSNIIHPSKPRSPQWSPSLRFPQQDPIHPLSSTIRATCNFSIIVIYLYGLWKVSRILRTQRAESLILYAQNSRLMFGCIIYTQWILFIRYNKAFPRSFWYEKIWTCMVFLCRIQEARN